MMNNSTSIAAANTSGNANADDCRQFVWEQIHSQQNTTHWSRTDSVNFYAFFLLGWDLQRQYNEQRAAEEMDPELIAAPATMSDDAVNLIVAMLDCNATLDERRNRLRAYFEGDSNTAINHLLQPPEHLNATTSRYEAPHEQFN